MIPIRIDENSTDTVIASVLNLKEREIFCMPLSFEERFKAYIPDNRDFDFMRVPKDSSYYKKWGDNCYIVLLNTEVTIL